MTTTTTGPWRRWRKRGRSQRSDALQSTGGGLRLHLSTALAMFLVAGVWIELNLDIAHGAYCHLETGVRTSGSVYGFPLPWLGLGETVLCLNASSQTVVARHAHCEIYWPWALANFALFAVMLLVLARWMERRKQAG